MFPKPMEAVKPEAGVSLWWSGLSKLPCVITAPGACAGRTELEQFLPQLS